MNNSCGFIDCLGLTMVGVLIGTAVGGLITALSVSEKKSPAEPKKPITIDGWNPVRKQLEERKH